MTCAETVDRIELRVAIFIRRGSAAIKQSPLSLRNPVRVTRGQFQRSFGFIALAFGGALLAACQSGGESGLAGVSAGATAPMAGPMQCAVPLPGGPPPRPDRLRNFGTTAAWNAGRGVGRTVITGTGVAVGGPAGGIVAGGFAARTIRSGYDLRGGAWTIIDGAPDCGCSVTFQASAWAAGSPEKGRVSSKGCGNPLLATMNDWRLDETMTGYDAELLIYAADGDRIAVLKREDADYYSGTLSDGTPITLWR